MPPYPHYDTSRRPEGRPAAASITRKSQNDLRSFFCQRFSPARTTASLWRQSGGEGVGGHSLVFQIPCCVHHFQIDLRFSFSNRNHDRKRKSFRKNQRSIFLFQTLRDFSGEIRIRFSFQNRIAIENPRRDRSSDVTMTDRVDLNQLNFSQSIRDFFLKTGSCFLFQKQLPVFIFKSRP
jgi:hypothetical protein